MTVTVPLLLAMLISGGPQTTVTYRHLPGEAVDVTWYRWSNDGPVTPTARTQAISRNEQTMSGMAGEVGIVMVRAANGSYLIDGPFAWPEHDTTRHIDPDWRRTVTGLAPRGGAGMTPRLDWMPGDDHPGEFWPRCGWQGDQKWQCWGVRLHEDGVIAADAGGGVWWAAVSADLPVVDSIVLKSHRWGRLIVVRRIGKEAAGPLDARVMRVVPPPAFRMKGIRVTKEAVSTVVVTVLRASVWVSGGLVPPSSWLELRGEGAAPAYLPLDELSQGSRASPVLLAIDDERVLDGIVRSSDGRPIGGATVTVSRLIDALDTDRDPKLKPRRVSESQTSTGAKGTFSLAGLGSERYELLVWHPQFGRAVQMLATDVTRVDVRLEAAVVRGRVLVGGKPAAGVDVKSRPSPEAFMDSDDIVELRGGDGKTGNDGRFAVALAAAGGGDLTIGGGTVPAKRIPLPAGVSSSIDLGDIELGSPIHVTFALDQDSACELRGVGPIGRLGIHIITAKRTGPGLFEGQIPEAGPWAFSLFCGQSERPLAPPMVTITEQTKTLQMSVR